MESLIVGLLLAGVSGITFLAYRHPESYRKLELPQTWFRSVAYLFICALGWNYAVSKTSSAFMAIINASDMEKAQKITYGLTLHMNVLLIIGGVFILIWFFLVFLHFLHAILEIKKPDND
jgi:hypothetical protein